MQIPLISLDISLQYHQMSLSTEISYYLRIAIEVNKKVGGTRAYEAQNNTKDRFIVIRDNVNKNFHFIRTKLEERDRKRGAAVGPVNAEIKQKIEEIYDQLDRMRQTVSNQKSNNSAAQDLKYQLIDRMKTQTNQLQDILENVSTSQRTNLIGKNNQTYTEMRAQLLDGGGKQNSKPSTRIQSNNKNNQPTEMEMGALKRWQDTDRKIDDRVQILIENTKRWKQGVLQTGVLIDETDKKIQKLTQDVDKVNDDLFKSNKQLKGIVEKFRKPHKFCLDIVLVLVLIGLIVGIIKLANK